MDNFGLSCPIISETGRFLMLKKGFQETRVFYRHLTLDTLLFKGPVVRYLVNLLLLPVTQTFDLALGHSTLPDKGDR
jgi:hypothetical protein